MHKANLIKTAALSLAMVGSAGILAGEAGTGETTAPANSGTMPMMHPMQGGMPMMGAPGAPGGMMNPQMMQQMLAMHQQHMQTVETQLANIEALLRELVELQKQK